MHSDFANIVIASAFAALIFSLFSIQNYFSFFLSTLFFFILFYVIKFLLAHRFGFKLSTRFLTFRRFWFGDKYKTPYPIPAWLIFPLVVSALTYNGIKLLTILGYSYEPTIKRLKSRFSIDERDMAKIDIASLLIIFAFTALFHYIGLSNFAAVGAWFIVSNMLPIASLDGGKIFHATWLGWSFYFVFFVISLALIQVTGIIISLVLAAIFALSLFIYLLYWYLEKRK
jgi:hypothetical protein